MATPVEDTAQGQLVWLDADWPGDTASPDDLPGLQWQGTLQIPDCTETIYEYGPNVSDEPSWESASSGVHPQDLFFVTASASELCGKTIELSPLRTLKFKGNSVEIQTVSTTGEATDLAVGTLSGRRTFDYQFTTPDGDVVTGWTSVR